MAKRNATFVPGTGKYQITTLAADTRIVGVVLKTEIPLGIVEDAGVFSEDLTAGTTKVRPTNVTATISSEIGATNEPDYILLKNGNNGGFSQELPVTTGGIYQVNSVIDAVITQP